MLQIILYLLEVKGIKINIKLLSFTETTQSKIKLPRFYLFQDNLSVHLEPLLNHQILENSLE